MKKNPFPLYISALAVIGLIAAFVFGCQKNQTGSGPGPSGQASQFVSVEKTSFNDVTSQLDPGGNFYMYLGTAQWLENLSGRLSAWQDKFTSMPDITPEQLDNVNKAFNLVTNLVKDSGIEDISGLGLSSVEIEQGIYRNKALVHHYAGQGTGFMWQFFGKEPHPLTGLDFCPDDTALAWFSDADYPLLWSAIQKDVNNSNIPQAQEWMQKLPDAFEKKTNVKWDQFLNSLGGEFGLVLTLDPSNNVPIPIPPSSAVLIPSPGLMLIVKVNDDTIFNRIDEALKNNQMVTSSDKADLKMRTMSIPLPLPFPLRPTAASAGGYLFIASSDTMIEDALAVKSGQKPGLKSTDEFKHLSQNIPDQGNQYAYMSTLFGKTLYDVQKQMMASGARRQPAQAQWAQSLFQQRPAVAYSVGMNTPEGCLTVGNSSQSYANVALLPAVVVPAMLAAIAIPNFEKAREASQRNACINNLRQIDAAKQEWALEKGKTGTDTPTWDDLSPYIRGPVPLKCPAGGTYSINPVNEPPTCSISSHRLP